jgi:hypothetical protein
MGPVRLLDVDRGLWLVVASAPIDRYSEERINARLSDLDWVSRAAIAHEAVVETFIAERAVLPMKLFTIFTNDRRAVEHVRADRRRIAALVKRVENKMEWGIRVTLLPKGAPPVRGPRAIARRIAARGAQRDSGASYLAQKKRQRDAAVELARRASTIVVELYEALSARASFAKRRVAAELTPAAGPLLLDAAFLVPRSREKSFRTLAARNARHLARDGYRIILSGPWPPYTFVKD